MRESFLPPPKERVETRPVALELEDHRTGIVSQTLTSHHTEEPKKFLRENILDRERERGWKKEEKSGGQENSLTDRPRDHARSFFHARSFLHAMIDQRILFFSST